MSKSKISLCRYRAIEIATFLAPIVLIVLINAVQGQVDCSDASLCDGDSGCIACCDMCCNQNETMVLNATNNVSECSLFSYDAGTCILDFVSTPDSGAEFFATCEGSIVGCTCENPAAEPSVDCSSGGGGGEVAPALFDDTDTEIPPGDGDGTTKGNRLEYKGLAVGTYTFCAPSTLIDGGSAGSVLFPMPLCGDGSVGDTYFDDGVFAQFQGAGGTQLTATIVTQFDVPCEDMLTFSAIQEDLEGCNDSGNIGVGTTLTANGR